MFIQRISYAALALAAAASLVGCQSDGGGGEAAEWKSPAAAGATSAAPAGGSAAPAGGSASKADVCAKAKKAMDEGKAELLGMMFANEGAEPDAKAIGTIMIKVADGLRAAAAPADAELKTTIDEVAAGFEAAGKAADPATESEKIITPLEEGLKSTCSS